MCLAGISRCVETGIWTEEMSTPQPIPVAYDAHVDGFSRLVLKFLRNPEHPAVVWMQEATFVSLATHATREGEFYIPCKQGLCEPSELRALVAEMEKTNDKRLASGERAT